MTPIFQDAVREVDKHSPLPLPLPPRNPDPDPATRYADAALSIASATTEGVDRVTHEAKDLGTTARDMYDRLKAARAAAHNASIYVADPDEPPQRAARTTVAIYDEWKDRIDTAIEDGTLARAEQGAIETAHQAAEVADAAAERAIEAAPHVNDALSSLFDFLLNALADRAPTPPNDNKKPHRLIDDDDKHLPPFSFFIQGAPGPCAPLRTKPYYRTSGHRPMSNVYCEPTSAVALIVAAYGLTVIVTVIVLAVFAPAAAPAEPARPSAPDAPDAIAAAADPYGTALEQAAADGTITPDEARHP